MKSKVIEENNQKIFVKEKEKDIKELFEYLKQRDFNNIPNIIEIDESFIKYEYIDNRKIYDDYKKIGKILSNLHYKTAFYKDVSTNKYREIYEKLYEKIEYINSYYDSLISKIEQIIYPSPSEYYFERNYSIINGAINYSRETLKNWFEEVKEKKKERVAIINNNVKLEHLLESGEKEYLVNWDRYVVDTPILDLYKLYLNENIDKFIEVYLEYKENFNLTEEEKQLFFVIISIPEKIELNNNEIYNIKILKKFIEKLYKTNELICSIEN